MRKSTYALILGTVLIVVGIVLSAGANYGLIRDTSTFRKDVQFGELRGEMLAELELSPGDSVMVMAPVYEIYDESPGKTLSVSVKDTFNQTIAEQNFVIQDDRAYLPDITRPTHLFTADTAGEYAVYAAAIRGNYIWDIILFNVVVSYAAPYVLVLLIGLIVLALGIIIVVLGVKSRRKQSLPRY